MIFFFNDTATTEIYTLSLHDALPISGVELHEDGGDVELDGVLRDTKPRGDDSVAEPLGDHAKYLDLARLGISRSEEHTSELQSQSNLVCRLLLEKKNKINRSTMTILS